MDQEAKLEAVKKIKMIANQNLVKARRAWILQTAVAMTMILLLLLVLRLYLKISDPDLDPDDLFAQASSKLLGRPRIRSGASDHLPGQLELHGDNGERRPNIGEITAHQHPIFLALRENKIRRGDASAQSDSAHVC